MQRNYHLGQLPAFHGHKLFERISVLDAEFTAAQAVKTLKMGAAFERLPDIGAERPGINAL